MSYSIIWNFSITKKYKTLEGTGSVLAKRAFPVSAECLPNSKLSNTYLLQEKSGRKEGQGTARKLRAFLLPKHSDIPSLHRTL